MFRLIITFKGWVKLIAKKKKKRSLGDGSPGFAIKAVNTTHPCEEESVSTLARPIKCDTAASKGGKRNVVHDDASLLKHIYYICIIHAVVWAWKNRIIDHNR